MRDNYFDLLRLILALLVAFEHSFLVFGGNAASPFGFLHMSLNHFAVNGFFVISGFLVTRSMVLRKDVIGFARSRILRIYPALAAMVVILALIIGPLFSSLSVSDYFSDPKLTNYALQILTFQNPDPPLPGVELDTFVPESLSIVLWTLRYEIIAYAATVVVFATGLLRRPALIALATVSMFAAHGIYLEAIKPAYANVSIEAFLRFGSCYLLGALLTLSDGWRSPGIVWGGVFLILGVILVRGGYPFSEVALNTALGFTLLSAAFVKLPDVFTPLQSIDDISYGLYIWHWPVFQLVGHLFPSHGTLGIMTIGFPISIGIATLSWFLVEKSALSLKTRRPQLERSL